MVLTLPSVANAQTSQSMKSNLIYDIAPLGFQYGVKNPFLFCAHHKDDYPPGNENLGPAASLAGRNLGEDFTLKDGWRMYHGLNLSLQRLDLLRLPGDHQGRDRTMAYVGAGYSTSLDDTPGDAFHSHFNADIGLGGNPLSGKLQWRPLIKVSVDYAF